MSEMQTVTLRMPVELKFLLENEAKQQGISFEELANYLMVAQLRQIEILSVESRRAKKSLADLKLKVNKILDGVPKREDVPDWDSFE
uniref:hypothetical protein n=1 Tax=Candidatus Electronema sp. TaxID=2698783 RepID=UPI0040579723